MPKAKKKGEKGSELEKRPLRLSIERALVQDTASFNVNIVHTPEHKNSMRSDFHDTFVTGILTGFTMKSLSPYFSFGEISLPFPEEGGCIYCFINPKTKRFYIGESSHFFKAKVMKRHRTKLVGYWNRKKENLMISRDEVLERVLQDFDEGDNKLLFACLE